MDTPILPPELYNLILLHLNVNDLLSCRATCRLFKALVDQIKIRSLAVSKEENAFKYRPRSDDSRNDYFMQFHEKTEDLALSSHLLSSSSLRTLRALNLSQLRKLIINRIEVRTRSGFDMIASFEQLEYLEINSFYLYCTLVITLPNLRTFKAFDSISPGNSHIRFATPSLTTLETDCFMSCTNLGTNRLFFSYPESLKRLIVCSLDRNTVENFRNLEYLECYEAHRLAYLELRRFRELKQVNCGYMTMSCALAILKQRKEENMNFDLFYRGLKINHLNELNTELVDQLVSADPVPMRRLYSRPLSTRFLFIYYPDLIDGPLPMARELNYEDYLECFPNGSPENFTAKFFNVRKLNCTSKIEQPDHFVELLKKFKHLRTLKLTNTGLTDDFYIRHLHLFSGINELEIYDQPNTIADLEIVFRFKQLEKFSTNQQVSPPLISSLFEKLTNFRFARFLIGERTFEIDWGKRDANEKPGDTVQVRVDGASLNPKALEALFGP